MNSNSRNTKCKLDTNNFLTSLWAIWKLTGVHGSPTWSYLIYGVTVNLVANVISPVFVVANIFLLKDAGLIFNNLQISITLIFSTVKQLLVFMKLSNLLVLKDFINILDERAHRSPAETKYLENIVAQCQLLAPASWICYMMSLFSYATSGLIRKKLLFEGWFPFDWTSLDGRYYLAFFFQFLSTAFQITQASANDTYPSICITTLRGHIHALGMRVAEIGTDPSASREENFGELRSCVKDHKVIIRFLETIKPIIALTVLVQLMITAFIVCMTAVYFLVFNREFSETINGIIYIIAILGETFPVCYFGNVLMEETDNLSSAIYSCNWMNQTQKFRKCLIIFMQRSQRTNVILAGGLVPINLGTYTSMIRFSTSMFMVLSQLK